MCLKCTLMSMFKVYLDVSPMKYVSITNETPMSKYPIIQVSKYPIIQVSHRQYITQKALEHTIMLQSQVPRLSDPGILHIPP